MSAYATLPDGPKGPVPIQTLAWFVRPVPYILKAQRRYGDVWTMQVMGEVPWVMLGHPDHVKEVFTGSPDKLLAGEGNELFRPILGDQSVLVLDRAEHLRERKLILPAFHGERMQRYGDLMREIAEQEIASWPANTELSLAPRMQAVTLEIIIRAVFGVTDAERLDAMRTALRELLEFITKPLTFATLIILGIERAPKLPQFRRIAEPVDRLIAEEITAHRNDPDLADRDDILSLLLQATDEDGNPMSDQALRDELLTLLVAGHETTATALSWACERLLRHPQALDRLKDEVAADQSDYSLAVAYETLRLRPVLPLVLRSLAEPMTIAGLDLPAGVKVAPSIVMIHRREDLYPDPHAFKPERFVNKKPGTYEWIPFGGGVRRCLGAAFALYEMQVVLEAIVRNADLKATDQRPEGVVRRAITFAPQHGARVVRQPTAAREPVAA